MDSAGHSPKIADQANRGDNFCVEETLSSLFSTSCGQNIARQELQHPTQQLSPSSIPPPPPPPAAAADLQELPFPLTIATQPSMADFLLDPATPSTPHHRAAEVQLTTGDSGKVLKRHMDSVFKVLAVHSRPDYESPWSLKQQTSTTSTGFAIKHPSGARWLITNAHSVSYARQVSLKRRGDDFKFPGSVLAVGSECDLALLTVEDDAFWQDIIPLELSTELPRLQQNVAVVGYPIGGQSLAVSAGVVSRLQMTHYSFASASLLAIQTDAAINSGNSGGPVLNKAGKAVGVAFQSLTGDVNNIGYVIPHVVVDHFLTDFLKNGKYTGFPSLNILWQEMESMALKAAFGLGPHHKGILIRRVNPTSSEHAILQQGDILLEIDGVELGSDGTVPFREGERVDFKYLITQKYVGDSVQLTISRKGQRQDITVNGLQDYAYLVSAHLHESRPSYLICGGLVFTTVTDPYLIQRYGQLQNAPVRLLTKTYYGVKDVPEQEMVVLSNILVCSATRGYESASNLKDSPVVAFNGHPIISLKHLARLIADATRNCTTHGGNDAKREKEAATTSNNNTEQEAKSTNYLRFDLESGNKVVVLEAALAEMCTQQALHDHNISNRMSQDILIAMEPGN